MYRNILVPLAPGQTHPKSNPLEIARAVAAEGADITALTVLEPIPDYVGQYLPEHQLRDNAHAILEALKAEVEALPNVKADVVLGHAGKAILDYAKEHGSDCIVVASHRPEFQDYFLGSTAARVVRHAECSVLVVR
jgi:nucleotide-binding universal stress UspA family protein